MALVNLKRTVEKNKAEKIQQGLHLLDFPKQNQHIFFVSDPKEITASSYKVKPDDEDDDDIFTDSENPIT